MAEEERDSNKTVAATENGKLRAATEAFQRKYRSMSLYGDHVLEVANRSNRALLCLAEDNRLRFFCKKLVESKTFEYFILLTIASNCIVLTLDKPLPNGDFTELNKSLEMAELVFVVIYFLEALIKIIAYGFVLHPNAYLRNGWNILDFVVVIVGVVGTILTRLNNNSHDGTESLKVLRAVRVLRPLKLVSGIPSLQVVMKSIARAMTPLLQIMCLVLFVIVIYAMIGLELLRGKFHYTCYENNTDTLDSELLVPRICSKPGDGGRPCRQGTTCQRHDNSWEGPNNGITTFDNIFLAMLTVFQCITNEGWTTIMYHSYDAKEYKVGWITSIIYVSLIIIGSFFMLNLVLGVLSGEFAKERERVENRRAFFKLRRQEQLKRQLENYKDWIAKAEDIMLREEREQHGVGEGGPRDPLKKRISLSDSIMHLIEDRGEFLSQLKEKRRNSSATFAERSSFLRKLKKREKRVRLFIRTVVKSQVFYWAVIVCVFLNTLVMSVEYHGQPLWLQKMQFSSEIVFLGIFIAEMLLKMYGLGPRAYFNSAFNRFDFAVVLCGIIDLMVQKYTGYSFSISVLRSLRLFRIFKFTRFWSSLRNLVTSLLNSMRSILSLIFLLLLFIFIFALLGMTLFGGKFSEKQDAPRTNFDSFEHAMLAVFQIMTGEDWNTVMNHGIEASGGPHSAVGMLASLYFVALVILGNYTLLNVFLAIAVDNLANAQALTKDEEEEERAREQSRRRRLQKKKNPWARARQIPMIMAIKNLNNAKNDNPFHNMKPAYSVDHSPRGARWNNKSALRLKFSQDNSTTPDSIQQNGQSTSRADQENATDREEENEDENKVTTINLAKSLRSAGRMMRRRNIPRNVPIIRKSSMFIFGPDSPIRRLCHWVVNLRYFDDFILFVIALSSVLLAFESPIQETNEMVFAVYRPSEDVLFQEKEESSKFFFYVIVLQWFDYIITGIFTFEVLVKMIDLGVILHKGSYLRSGWNVIDTFVVACNIAAIVLNSNQATTDNSSTREAIKSFRVFRVFRPIKAINKSKQLKTVFECMMYSVKNVRNILLITLLFYFIFAVIGVQLFKGKLYYCTDPSKMTEFECKGYFFKYKTDHDGKIDLNNCEVKERLWRHHRFTFDNVGEALLTLFSSSTGEGWPDHMHHTIDATEENYGPRRNNQIHMALYYVCFVVVFNFFFLNIFVALIIVTFQEQGEKEIVDCELDRNQRDCIQFAMNAKPRQRYMPEDKNTIFYKVWVIVDSKPFEIFIMTLIALNAVVLMLSFDGKGADEVEKILDILNTVFTVLFLLEAILKLIAFKQNYFKDYWNCFDFVIVMTTFVGVVLMFVDTQEKLGIDPSFFRLFRAARLVKLLRQGYTIRILLWTFFQSFKALPYVVILLAMLFFIYAVIGMQLFGKIEISEDWSKHINYHNNFQSFFGALQVLFRCATGENWPLVMLDCFSNQPCNKKLVPPQTHCGSTFGSITYFVTFYFFCSFLMLNLFVAVIMDNFEYLTRDESILGPHHLDEFVRVWSEYDPGATGRIKHTQVYHLMCDMSPPVGFGRKCPKFIAYKRLIKMNMPIMGDNTVLFTSTLFALIRTALGIFNTGDPAFADGELRRVIKRLWPKTYKKTLDKMIPTQSVLSSQQMTIGKIYCAKLIYENYKHMQNKRKLERAEQKKHRLDVENDGDFGHHKRRPSLFRRLVGALRNGNSNSDEEEEPRRPSQQYLTMRRRSKTMETLPSFKQKQEQMNRKRRMHRSLKFFRKPFGRNDSNATESEEEGRRIGQRSVHFKDAPMDLTDINPTIISTDTDEETNAEMAPGASGTLSRGNRKRRRSIKLSFKNPVALEDAEEETRTQTAVHTPTQMASPPHSSCENRSLSSTGHSSPLFSPMVRIEIPSPQPPEEDNAVEVNQRAEGNKTAVVALDPFPDVIKSAESSPRHSLAPIGDYFAGFNKPEGHRTREIINQLNEEITQAVRRGQSPYALYGIQDNDEETWC